MKDFACMPDDVIAAVDYVLADIDDTMTTAGKLPWESFRALWLLKEAGLKVVPITGRPAGWCDMIARFWPVDGVVGENGAFAFYLREGRMRELLHPEADRRRSRETLERIRSRVLTEVPGSRVARDQFARIFDLAIDFNEEPPYLGRAAAVMIKRICEEEGAVAKISSIHVNAWTGTYDKLSMTGIFLKEVLGCDIERGAERCLFCGDSPNDVPMFGFFPVSCGVANCLEYIDLMEHKPACITRAAGGLGFAEIAERIVKVKRGL